MAISSGSGQFLYDQVKDYLTRELRSGGLGENGKIPSERTLSESLSISRGTLRIALAELEKDGFIEKLPYKGTFVRKAGDSRPIRLALIFPEAKISRSLGMANYQMANEAWRGIVASCNGRNASLSLLYCSEDPALAQDFCDRIIGEYDGAFFIGHQLQEVRNIFSGHGFPFIVLGVDAGGGNVGYKRAEICEKSANFLIDCGVKKLMFLAFDIEKISSFWEQKYGTFCRIFQQKGLVLNENLLIFVPLCDQESECLRLLEAALPVDMELPDAFFCSTPMLGYVLMHLAAKRHWRVPEKVMIFGYDMDTRLRPTIPQITHVRLPHYEIGLKGGELLIHALATQRPVPKLTLVDAQLITGETTINKNKEKK